ncbi:response regulator [uncultured Campylobacter sp.]|uniref:response regulator transcription factor n=1 Tax=uncultured Campylobacter sp. TaxID=218934 RepID=UPI00261C243E|nr:response regulator [uncultured Campylobacter sp.]
MKKILLLEDDLCLSEIVYEFLVEEGFDVSLTHNAKEAYELSTKSEYDLYILDVKIPIKDGFSLLKEIRERGDNTPALFLTSLNTNKDLKEGFKSGCDDYIVKPFQLNILKKHIVELLFYKKRKRYQLQDT